MPITDMFRPLSARASGIVPITDVFRSLGAELDRPRGVVDACACACACACSCACAGDRPCAEDGIDRTLGLELSCDKPNPSGESQAKFRVLRPRGRIMTSPGIVTRR